MFLFGLAVFLLHLIQFPAEECQQPVILSDDCTKLKLRTVSVDLKLLQVVRIGQDNIFGDCSLHLVEYSLMQTVPMSWLLVGLSVFVALVYPHSPTKLVSGDSISLHLSQRSLEN